MINKYRIIDMIRFILGFHKTILINFNYLAFNQAIRLPIWVSNKCIIRNLKGTIIIENKIKPGMIKIGFGNVGVINYSENTIFSNEGDMVFHGKTNIGYASKIDNHGFLSFGDKFVITAKCAITCYKEIIFGDEVLISYDTLIMDTDTHKIYKDGERMNENKRIIIGNHVWIGTRVIILKGSEIADNCILGAGSIINTKITKSNSLWGGIPAKVKVMNINWDY